MNRIMETNNRKILCFEADVDSQFVEVVQWESEPDTVSLNLPEGDYEIDDGCLLITTDYGRIRVNFATKLQNMKIMWPEAFEKLEIKKVKREEPHVESKA